MNRTLNPATMGPASLHNRFAWLLLAIWILTDPVHAFVYPEHRDIAIKAVETLDPEHRAVFDKLWREARLAKEKRLCEQGADSTQSVMPGCVDWAALTAIAGDHSCSSQDLTGVVLESDWILAVADVAAQLKLDLSRIDVLPPTGQVPGSKDAIQDMRRRIQTETAAAERQNALRTADLRLQRADARYATRAGSNNAHFLLPRPQTDTTPGEYGTLTMTARFRNQRDRGLRVVSPERNAEGHPACKRTACAGRARGARARHAVRRGLRAALSRRRIRSGPRGRNLGRHGPTQGYARLLQRRRARSIRVEREPRVDGNHGGRPYASGGCGSRRRICSYQHRATARCCRGHSRVPPTCRTRRWRRWSPTPSMYARTTISSSGRSQCPRHRKRTGDAYATDLREVLLPTPVPGLGPGLGAMPRFRSEVGPFSGMSGMIDARGIDGGFTVPEGSGFIGGVEVCRKGRPWSGRGDERFRRRPRVRFAGIARRLRVDELHCRHARLRNREEI